MVARVAWKFAAPSAIADFFMADPSLITIVAKGYARPEKMIDGCRSSTSPGTPPPPPPPPDGAVHWLVLKTQFEAHDSVPPEYPKLSQVAPSRLAPSHCSGAWMTLSPHDVDAVAVTFTEDARAELWLAK